MTCKYRKTLTQNIFILLSWKMKTNKLHPRFILSQESCRSEISIVAVLSHHRHTAEMVSFQPIRSGWDRHQPIETLGVCFLHIPCYIQIISWFTLLESLQLLSKLFRGKVDIFINDGCNYCPDDEEVMRDN